MYTSKTTLLIFIFIAVWWSLVNFGKIVGGDRVPGGNFILQAIGIVGIVAYFL